MHFSFREQNGNNYSSILNMVWQVKGYLKGKFDEPGIDTIFKPWGLVYEFFYAIFFDRVDIGLLFLHQVLQFAACRFRVAVENIPADEHPTAVALGALGGFVIHFQDDAVGIRDGDGSREFLNPGKIDVFHINLF